MLKTFKEYIKDSGFSNREIAESISVSPSTIIWWLSGKSIPTNTNLYRLSELLGINFTTLKKSLKALERDHENANVISKAIIESGLKKEEIAKRIGISASSVSSWASGKMLPPKKYKNAIERIFGLFTGIKYSCKGGS